MSFDPTFAARVERAAGRAIVGIAMQVAVETKRVTHVKHGTLRRSVHAAPAESPEGHEDDEREAQTADLMMTRGAPEPTRTAMGVAVEVGSWLPYACVEWIGRGHPGITEGLEVVRGERTEAILRQAFSEEGL